jgi:hypothetical protein
MNHVIFFFVVVIVPYSKPITALQKTGDTNSLTLPLMSHRKADNKLLFSSVVLVNLKLASLLRNDETIISSISITDIVFDVYLGKWSYRASQKVKTWSYFLTIP